MTNVRTRKPRILIEAPIIPPAQDKKHVGTRVQFSSSTDFTDSSAMIFDKTIYAPDDILNIMITKQDGSPLEISLDDVYYFRYQLIYDSVSHPTNNPDQYTKDIFSIISSIYGDQEGFRYDRIIISTPQITVKEISGTLGKNNLEVSATGYNMIVGTGKHKYTTWIVETSDGEKILERVKDSDNLDKIILPSDLFKAGKLYNIKARFVSDTNGESNFGKCLYNKAIAKNDYMDVNPSGDLNYGNDLFFKVTTKMPNVTGIAARLCSVVGNTEVDIPARININGRTIHIEKFTDINGQYSLLPTMSITNVFKLYVRPIVNGDTNVVWSNMITYTFMLDYPKVYPIDYSSNYPGLYTMTKDLDIGPTISVSKELKNGTIPLLISGGDKVRLYARYGNTLRPTNVEFTLPLDTGNSIIPYLNVLELYDGNVMLNYTVYDANYSYKKSSWSLYSVNYSTNEWTLLSTKVFDDEEFNTSTSSSCFVSRDGSLYYIPAGFIEYVPNTTIPDIAARFLSSNLDVVKKKFDPYIVNSSFGSGNGSWSGGTEAVYSVEDGMVKFKCVGTSYTIDDALSISVDELTMNTPSGYTVEFDLKIPSSFSPDADISGTELGVFGISNDAGSDSVFSIGLDKANSSGDTCKFKVRFGVTSGSPGTSEEVTTTIQKGVVTRVSLVVTDTDIKLFFNAVEVKTGSNGKSIQTGERITFGSGTGFDNGGEFYFDKISIYSAPFDANRIGLADEPDKIGSNVDLPLLKLSYVGNKLVRETMIPAVKSGITKHMTICPYTTDGVEKIIVLGGTNNTTIDVDISQPGIVKYSLLNRNIGILTKNGAGWNVSWIESNGIPVELPTLILPDDYYNLSAFRRCDGRIVIFNNCPTGPGSEDTSSFVLDINKITPTELQEGWFVKNKNDSRIDLPFRSTIQMKNGDYVRLSYQETLTSGDLSCKVLLYPHQPLTDYTDTDAPITINKNLVVPVGSVMSIENPYLYDSITIDGDSPDNTGHLIWTDVQGTRTLDYSYKIITRDTVSTTAEVDALGKEKFIVLSGVEWRIDDK